MQIQLKQIKGKVKVGGFGRLHKKIKSLAFCVFCEFAVSGFLGSFAFPQLQYISLGTTGILSRKCIYVFLELSL